MNLYFDTEFTGLRKNTTLVSIGMISEDGKTFYAELSDYDKSWRDPWFIDNVESKLLYNTPCKQWFDECADTQIYGSKQDVASELEIWLQQFDSVTLVSDVCHYDMVLLIDLFGTAFDLPPVLPASCHDINQDIARFLDISESLAFDMNREKLIYDIYGETLKEKKHNALYDAKVIRLLYQGLQKELN